MPSPENVGLQNTENENTSPVSEQAEDTSEDAQSLPVQQEPLRRSTRNRSSPVYLKDYV